MTPRLSAGSHTGWSYRLQQLPAWALASLVAAILLSCWALVYAAGGTRTAVPHVFYVPIVLAALPFGIPGGIVVGVAATLLSGPAMPLDVAAGEAQEAMNWLARGGFFIAIGALSGSTTGALRSSFEADIARRLRGEMEPVAAPQRGGSDAAWEARIRTTLDRNGFRAVFQPIYTLDDGTLILVEALTRFSSAPEYPPDVWFAQAQRAGLGIELELATLGTALNASRGLDESVAMSFNASPCLLTDPRLLQLLDRHPGRRLVVEVTEHAVIEDYRAVAAALATLRERGLQVAVDDAGAGFASLRHIVRLQPDLIKLDPSLTQNLGKDPIRTPLADALIQFAARTGSHIIVEGIENASDLGTWRELGAHAAQGHLLARPGLLPFPARFGSLLAWPQPVPSPPRAAIRIHRGTVPG